METDEKKICPYCGEEILAIARKCRYCGEWLPEETEQKAMITCPICGEEIEEGTEICPYCNEFIDTETDTQDPEAAKEEMDNYQKLFDCPDSSGSTSDVESTDNIADSSRVDDIEDYSSIVESETETSETIQDRNENKEATKEETEVVKSNDSTYKNSYEDDSSGISWEYIIGVVAVLILIGIILFAVANSCSSDKADQEEQTTTESTSYPEPSTSSTSSQSYEGSSSNNSSESENNSNGSQTGESVYIFENDSEVVNASQAIKAFNSKTPFNLGHSLTLTECSYDPYKNVVFMRIIVEKMEYFYDPESNTQHIINLFSNVPDFSNIFKAVEASFELQFLNNQDNNWTEGKFSALDL